MKKRKEKKINWLMRNESSRKRKKKRGDRIYKKYIYFM